MPKKTVCLCMIVKNEAPVVARCLASVRPIVDSWLVVDTGSTDGTQAIIRRALADLPGELIERPWVDFAHNRSEALTLARPYGDYSLVIDADDELVAADADLPPLDADAYEVEIADEGVRYRRTQLVANRHAWRYRGVLHEFLEAPEASNRGSLPLVMRRNHDGARRRDPKTYTRDAAILERALQSETDPFMVARYTFYLAQSRRDCGDAAGAVDAYLKRADQGFWVEEVYVSLLNAGRLMQGLGRPLDETLATLARASAACPHRAEAAHEASRLCRLDGRNTQGYEVGQSALTLEPPAAGLFVEPWIYAYGLADEFAVNAYWSGHHAASLEACLRALGAGNLPEAERSRLLANARHAAEKLGTGGSSWDPDAPTPPPFRRLATRRPATLPRVLVALLAKQKASVLPFFLERIAALDYPKDRIVLYVRTNNNTDDTREILRNWLAVNGDAYAAVDYDDRDLPASVEGMGVHEWNATRFRVMGAIRATTLEKTIEHDCDFLFPVDVDNFVLPFTLRELVALNLPIVAPLVREARTGARYANFHAKIDAAGYFLETPRYDEILLRRITGLIELPVVHCTYLVRGDVIPKLRYQDGSQRHEYVIFSESARHAGIPQYLDNRQLYGYLTLHDDEPAIIAEQLATLAPWFSQGDRQYSFPY